MSNKLSEVISFVINQQKKKTISGALKSRSRACKNYII